VGVSEVRHYLAGFFLSFLGSRAAVRRQAPDGLGAQAVPVSAAILDGLAPAEIGIILGDFPFAVGLVCRIRIQSGALEIEFNA
jgi:hypothetical protein